MHFPSDDELMAGPNAFEGVDLDALELPDEDSQDDEDIDAELDEADDERAHDVEDSVQSLRQLRAETNAGADIIVPDFPEDFRAGFISIVGRPNVGKSSLVNRLLGEERVIVSDVPGTTRDAIDTHFTKDGAKYLLIDTAGMRRKGKITLPVERYSVMRSLRAIDRAGVVLMVINAAEGILEQDTKIAGYVHESGKGVIIVVNKWDIFPEKNDKSTLRFTDDLREKLGFLQYAPVLYTSALTGQRVERVTELVKYVAEQQSMRIKTSVLNELIRDAVSVNPPPTKKGKQLKILFVTQVSIVPPTFIIFVNDPELMHFSYLRFIENRLRESFGFEGTPIRLVVRARKEEEQ